MYNFLFLWPATITNLRKKLLKYIYTENTTNTKNLGAINAFKNQLKSKKDLCL